MLERTDLDKFAEQQRRIILAIDEVAREKLRYQTIKIA
jgi:hypothetical protein